jgi:AcrR family transcriptional regulator
MVRSLPPAGEDLLATALELFARRGIGAVGVNELTQTAGHTRDTLYRIFKSKTGLVVATIDRYMEELPWLRFLQATVVELDRGGAVGPTKQGRWARDQLLDLMDEVTRWSIQRGDRGCYLLTAAAELRDDPDRAVGVDRQVALERIRQGFHRETRRLLRRLAGAAGASNPTALADALQVQIYGILTTAAVATRPPSRAAARSYAAAMLAQHGATG